MQLILKKFYYFNNKKNLMLTNLLEFKDRMLNYISLTYSIFLYLFKLSLCRLLSLFKKIVPINIKFKVKKIFFYNSKFWNLIVFVNNWIKIPPSINKRRQINYIFFNLISIFFIPLFVLITKKEKWEILMLEKLNNNSKLKEKFITFNINNQIPKSKNLSLQNNKKNLSSNEIDILENFNKALVSKENHHK